MADKKSVIERLEEAEAIHRATHYSPPNWRIRAAWASWESPVGLGLFFVLMAFTTWILFHL